MGNGLFVGWGEGVGQEMRPEARRNLGGCCSVHEREGGGLGPIMGVGMRSGK